MVFIKGEPTRLGTKHSEETKKRMSDSHKSRIALYGHNLVGVIPSEETRNRISDSLTGRVFTDEHKRKISEGLKRNPPNKGWTYERWMEAFPKILVTAIRDAMNNNHAPYNNHSWKKLRRKVYERDGFICQECACDCNDSTRISCHHIDFNRANNSMDNLITLCGSCHGKTTQKPEEWIQYYQDKMMMKNNKNCKTSSDAESA